MLRSFHVANHRSFLGEQGLLLMPSYDRERRVVPVAAIYGANASGKSNLLDAMRWVQSAVLESSRRWEPDWGVPRNRCRLADEDVPTSFTVDLILGGVQYVYGLVVDSDVVREEWLHTFPHGRERVIFERDGSNVTLGSTVRERRLRAAVLSSVMRDNALLLTVAASLELGEVMPVYRWFRDSLLFGVRQRQGLPGRLQSALARFPDFVELLKVADFGITSVSVVDAALAQSNPAQSKEIVFRHGPDEVRMGVEDESDGTLAWIDLLISVLIALDDGAVLMVDEIDASLHPRLAARLVELFRSSEINKKAAQLVFTTHDVTMLGTCLGEDLLRRDEIWFVEKQDGSTRLFPLSDFHPRKGENRERRYLIGSYGAVPAVFEDSLVRSMLEKQPETSDAKA